MFHKGNTFGNLFFISYKLNHNNLPWWEYEYLFLTYIQFILFWSMNEAASYLSINDLKKNNRQINVPDAGTY